MKRSLKEITPVRRYARSESGRLFGLLLAALLLVIQMVLPACAGRDIPDPVTNTDAVGPGASARAPKPGADDGEVDEEGYVSVKPRDGQVSVEDESWFLVTDVKGDRAYSVFVDTDTIDTVEGEVMSWSRLVFEEDQKDSDGLVYREVRIASAINCEKRTYMYQSSKFYDSLGRMVFNENIATDRSPIPGGTVSEYIANFVCGYKPDSPGTGSAPPPGKTP